jgi:hypothetical protein
MPRQQRTYTKEFKDEAVRLMQTRGKSMSQVARDLGIFSRGHQPSGMRSSPRTPACIPSCICVALCRCRPAATMPGSVGSPVSERNRMRL